MAPLLGRAFFCIFLEKPMRLSGSAIACFLAASGFATALTMSFAVHAGLQSSDTITDAAPVNTTAQQAKEKTFSLLDVFTMRWF